MRDTPQAKAETTPSSGLSGLRQCTVALIGAGRMGGAMLDGWVGLGLDPTRLVVIEPQPTPAIATLTARGLRLNPDNAASATDVVVVAVKPQSAPDAMTTAARLVAPAGVVISIMAGRTIAFLEAALGRDLAIVRAMPNTPAAIGRGITVAVANRALTPPQRDLANALLSAIGAVEWVGDETLMDAVTAVSGSGPAYVFLLAESLARAGERAGLPAALAKRLARETVSGSGALLHRSPLDTDMLRRNVTSPGGTTEAALNVLMATDGLDRLIERAVEAAAKRSRQLAD